MGLALLLLRLGLAAVFVVAAAGKAMDFAGSRQAAQEFGLTDAAAAFVGPALPVAEALVAAGLVITLTGRWAAVAAVLLLGAFIGGMARLIRAGQAPDCHCFGQIHSEPVSRGTLARNGVLVVLAVVVAVGGAGRSLASFGGAELALILTGLLAAVLAAAVAVLAAENRELRRRPAVPQGRGPAGLAKGALAPAFRLPDVGGGEVALSEQLASGRPVILAFVSPSCGPCRALMPQLGRWQHTLSETVGLIALSEGEMQRNRDFADEMGVEALLVAPDDKVRLQYEVRATPSAVLLDPDGRIATTTVAGAQAIEALVRAALRRQAAPVLTVRPG